MTQPEPVPYGDPADPPRGVPPGLPPIPGIPSFDTDGNETTAPGWGPVIVRSTKPLEEDTDAATPAESEPGAAD